MGSLFKPKTQYVAPPQQAEPVGFKSEITGVEQIPVKNADGTTTIIERQILTPEQKAVIDRNNRIAEEQLNRIEQLTNNYDISQIDGLSEQLDNFRTSQYSYLDKAVREARMSSEKNLAKFGQADSSAAADTRTQLNDAELAGKQQIEKDASAAEQDIRNQEIARSTNLLGIVGNEQQQQNALVANTLSRGAGIQSNFMNAMQGYNNSVYQANVFNAQQKMQASQAGMQNMMGLASMAALLAGPMGFGLYGAAGAGGTAAGAGAGAAALSDRRAKTEIVPIGRLGSGLTLYTFRYKTGGGVQVGCMADEVEKVFPAAVVTRSDGMKMVKYGEIW